METFTIVIGFTSTLTAIISTFIIYRDFKIRNSKISVSFVRVSNHNSNGIMDFQTSKYTAKSSLATNVNEIYVHPDKKIEIVNTQSRQVYANPVFWIE